MVSTIIYLPLENNTTASTTAGAVSDSSGTSDAPLRSWIDREEKIYPLRHNDSSSSPNNNNNSSGCSKESIIRKTAIAYGIVELLKRYNGGRPDEEIIRIDNFMVTVSQNASSSHSWDDIKGVSMLSTGLSLTIEEPAYLSGLIEEEEAERSGQIVGRYLEAELTTQSLPGNSIQLTAALEMSQSDENNRKRDENNRCHLFARLLYELFTHEPFPDDALAISAASANEPAQKKSKASYGLPSHKKLMLSRAKEDFERTELPFQLPSIIRMQKLGIPASLCLMMQNLMECVLKMDGGRSDDAYDSLGVVGEDLHLLLLDPDRFLFDNEAQNSDDMHLLYRREKLYGRDKEETLITDAFCRVSRGKSEAFFIGGFSGSGKSMLVNSLLQRVDVVGHVIKHKFDTMAQEKPLSGVISAFNQLCLKIKTRRSKKSFAKVAAKLKDEFGVDLSLLMRLMPNVSLFFPEFAGSEMEEQASDTMNVRSVCFTLLRFVRVVSSPLHPVILFLDDIQWADSSALDLIHTILSDTMGSCMFFVGTYRDNEVQAEHDIFDLMEKLKISNVPMTKVSLTGLDQEDLNTMISDALCLYPRLCESLSAIVFQKTKGSPFFVLEFMQSLQTRGLLQYNFHQKRWVWSEDVIRAEQITDNVLHLLSSKMNGLSDDVRMLLKVMACFGTSTHDSVIDYLCESAEYCGVRDGLEGAVRDGFVLMDGEGHFIFVHDHVREAAYDLISDDDKKQFHYNLGKILFSACEGKDVGNAIFLIASQINHGKELIQTDEEELRLAVAKLNMKAGKKALDGCDHETAYSFLQVALSLLPEDHWESDYDLSLRVSFLLASAASSCYQYDEAQLTLRRIFEKASCLEDKLPSYLLLSRTLQAQGKVYAVYDTCSTILIELGETIPESWRDAARDSSLITDEASRMITETLNMYEEVDADEWLKSEETDDKTLAITLQFFSAIALSSYFCRSYYVLVSFVCRAVQLSLRKGVCPHTPISLIQFTSMVINDENALSCYRIAQKAMLLAERFDVGAQIPKIFPGFYGLIAWRFEPFHLGADSLRRGFEAGLTYGNSDMGLHCAVHAIKNSIHSGANLRSLLKEIDYYLHVSEKYNSELTKNFILIFRETVSLLIDKGHASSIEAKACFGDVNKKENKFREAVLHHSAIRCFWLGHHERSQHFSEKCMNLDLVEQKGNCTACIVKFYYGLNAIDLLRKKRYSLKSKNAAHAAIAAMKFAAAKSDWNFTNKLRLLEAEHLSLNRRSHRLSIKIYDDSIASAQRSGFIHEQGLACEKAGFYFKRERKKEKAFEYFTKARGCYEEWGSIVKVDFIQKELDSLSKK